MNHATHDIKTPCEPVECEAIPGTSSGVETIDFDFVPNSSAAMLHPLTATQLSTICSTNNPNTEGLLLRTTLEARTTIDSHATTT